VKVCGLEFLRVLECLLMLGGGGRKSGEETHLRRGTARQRGWGKLEIVLRGGPCCAAALWWRQLVAVDWTLQSEIEPFVELQGWRVLEMRLQKWI
jgi:hypothetical protein